MVIDNELLYIFGISAIGTASLVYIIFGPSVGASKSHWRNTKAPIRGLQNVKNHCFINSILQSIASSDVMVNWITLANLTTKSEGKLIHQLCQVVDKINRNNDPYETITPHGVLNSLHQHRWVFSMEEQDAYELFNALTSTLETEYNHFAFLSSIRHLFCTEVGQNEIRPTFRRWTMNTRAMGKMIMPQLRDVHSSLPTRGSLANHLKCHNCGYKYPLHLDMFDSISLSLPANKADSSILLETCLSKFVRSELIEDFMCESCSHKSYIDKKVEFVKLPKLLCFHIQRLVWLTREQPVKRFDHLVFPEFLQMDPYTYTDRCARKHPSGGLMGGRNVSSEGDTPFSPSATITTTPDMFTLSNNKSCTVSLHSPLSMPTIARYRYILNSVIVHIGNSSSGHFICYRRKCDTLSGQSKWYYTSDLMVKEVNRLEVFSCCAYMLFYQRISDPLLP